MISQSDTTDEFQSYTEYYADFCGLQIVEEEEEEFTEEEIEDCVGGYSYSSSGDRRRLGSGGPCGSSSSSDRRRVRRRRSRVRRRLGSSSGGSSSYSALAEEDQGDGLVEIVRNDVFTNILVEVCLDYQVSFSVEDCVTVNGIFLALCERENQTTFNSSVLNQNGTDLTDLITFTGPNIVSAEGTSINGQLGIFVTFKNDTFDNQSLSTTFEICLGNVTVDATNLDDFGFGNFSVNTTRLLRTIEVSNGTVFTNGEPGIDPRTASNISEAFDECPIDGLPCFNFFFDAECPVPEEDDGVLRGCDCEDDIAAYQLTYTDPGSQGDISVTFTRTRRGSGGNYAEDVTLSDGDTIMIEAESLNKDAFKKHTGVFIRDEDGDLLCQGRITKCNLDYINEPVRDCEDIGLNVDFSVDNGGFTCDEQAVEAALAANDASSAYDNALINNELASSNPFTVFNDLDPYVKWTLIAIMITFLALICVACYICVARGKSDEEGMKEHVASQHEQALQMAKVTSNSTNNAAVTNNTRHGENESDEDIAQFDNEYYDEDGDNEYVTKKKNKVNTKDIDDEDDDDEYYDDENDENLLVEMGIDAMANDPDLNDEYLE